MAKHAQIVKRIFAVTIISADFPRSIEPVVSPTISFTATVQNKIYDAEYSGQPQSVTVTAIST